jgi:tRNA-dihydrouridine synthase 1
MAKTGYQFFESIGSPKYIVAPMVDVSNLAYRLLCRRYGAQLCMTPMLNSKRFVDYPEYRASSLTVNPDDRPLIVQFCGDDPDVLLEASRHVEHMCDGIDLNFGCPQGIARKGHYGAYLLEEVELITAIVTKLSQNLSIPVTCKIRIRDSLEKTFELTDAIVRAGCSMLTVHGRTIEQKKRITGAANWATIKLIKERYAGILPVICNGGIETQEDIRHCLEFTGCDGVMASEAIYENPALFYQIEETEESKREEPPSQLQLCFELLALAREFPEGRHSVQPHMYKMLYRYFTTKKYIDFQKRLGQTHDPVVMEEVIRDFAEVVDLNEEGAHWYRRFFCDWVKPTVTELEEGQDIDIPPFSMNNEEMKEDEV